MAVDALDDAKEAASRKPFGWRFIAPLLLGSTLNPINSSMIATALVGIGVDMHAGAGATASLISVLYLFSAVCQPTMGKLSRLFGPRRIFLTGVIILFVAGVIGAAAPSFAFLLVSRALIGIGTSACYPTAMALIRKRADDRGVGVPGRVLGNLSIAAQVTIIIGLPLGGVLAGTFGWRAIFAVNIPLALISIVLILIGVARDKPLPHKSRRQLLTALDVLGIAFFAGMVTSLLVFLADLASPTWWLLATAATLAAALFVWERRVENPLIDFRMLAKNLPLQRTYLRQMLTNLATYTALYGTSQWMEESMGLSPTTVGFILIPMSVTSIIIARVISGRGWVRWPLVLAGVALFCVAGALLMTTSESSVVMLIGMSLLFGASSGFAGFGNQAALYLQSSADEIAVGAGLLRTSSYIGAIFSSNLIGIVFGSNATDGGLHTLAWVLGGIGIVLVILTILDRSIPRRTFK